MPFKDKAKQKAYQAAWFQRNKGAAAPGPRREDQGVEARQPTPKRIITERLTLYGYP